MKKEKLTIQDFAMFVDSCEIKIKLKNERQLITHLGTYQLNKINEYQTHGLLEYAKPILRTYSQMSDEESKKLDEFTGSEDEYIFIKATIYMIRQGIDIFEWINEGLAIKKRL